MKAVMEALTDQHAELDALLGGLQEPDWERDVPDCPGWTVGDVVLHLAQTDELVPAARISGFPAAAERLAGRPLGSGTVDDLVALMVAHERGAPGAELRARWRSASTAVRELLADIVRAVGVEASATDRLWHIARLAWRSVPYAFARAGLDPPPGPVTVSLTAPDGGTWDFGTGAGAATSVTGSALDFCLVAARRLDPAAAELRADGPDAARVLALLRTYA